MFKERFIARRTRKNLEKTEVKHFTAGYDRAKKIGILFTLGNPEKQLAVREFQKLVEADHKKVEVLAVRPLKGKIDDKYFFDYFTKKDFNFWGKPTNEQLIRFMNTKFDFLFCLDNQVNLETAFVLSSSPAKSRIGHYAENDADYFEMMFKPKNNPGTKGLTQEILFYIKKLTDHEA